jgi:hypothetical protein
MRSFKGPNNQKRKRNEDEDEDNPSKKLTVIDEGNPSKKLTVIDEGNPSKKLTVMIDNIFEDTNTIANNDNQFLIEDDNSIIPTTSNDGTLYADLLTIADNPSSHTGQTAQGKVTTFIDKLNQTMTHSDAKLTKEQVLELSSKVNKIISDTYLVQEITNQLSEEPSGDMLKQVFHGLIEYYVSTAYYIGEQAPEVLTNIGALLAGSAIIGATIQTSSGLASASSGDILQSLTRYLPTTTALGTGLYLLQRGGVPIEQITTQTVKKMTEKAVSCVQRGCEKLVELASNRLDELLKSDDWSASSASSDSSASSASSVLSEASSKIKELLENAENQDNLKEGSTQQSTQDSEISELTMPDLSQGLSQGFSPRSPGSDSYFSARESSHQRRSSSPEELLSSQGTLKSGDMDSISMPSVNTDKGGNKKRKSRRHTKFRKTKRRVKKNRRLTKKGKKHYKTLKRYRRKMRR